jgi:MFS family permease
MQILTLNAFGRISDAFGNRLVLVATGWMIPIMLALWLFSKNFWYLLVVQALGGLVWAGFL